MPNGSGAFTNGGIPIPPVRVSSPDDKIHRTSPQNESPQNKGSGKLFGMKTQTLTRYFAVLLGLLASYGTVIFLEDLRSDAGTPWDLFGLFLCAIFFLTAGGLWTQRRWAVIVFLGISGLGAWGQLNPQTLFMLVHAIAAALVLTLRWRELK